MMAMKLTIGTVMNVQSRPEDTPPRMSIEAFFQWAQLHDRRYELVDGVPRLLPWVKRNHNRIVVNLVTALARQIDPGAYEIATGDFAVATGPHSIRFADVMVEVAGGSGSDRTTDKAVVLVEILSSSTMHVDFGPKTQEYLALAGLKTYLIIDQEKHRAWQWIRQENGEWPEEPLFLGEQSSEIEMNVIDARLTFSDIYRNVD
jgi:Uma2 family endonuclease